MNMNNLGLEICPKLRSQFVFPYHLDWNNSSFKYSWMLKWIWNMQSIAILLSHDVCLPLKRKLGFNDKLIGLFKKKNQWMNWAGLKSLLRCGPNHSNQRYPCCNPNIFKTRRLRISSCKIGTKKVSFKLQNWYKKNQK